MSNAISRRTFLKRSAAAGVTAGVLLATKKPGHAQTNHAKEDKLVGSIIDLTKCDGCTHKDTPACVLACKEKNEPVFHNQKNHLKIIGHKRNMKIGQRNKIASIDLPHTIGLMSETVE